MCKHTLPFWHCIIRYMGKRTEQHKWKYCASLHVNGFAVIGLTGDFRPVKSLAQKKNKPQTKIHWIYLWSYFDSKHKCSLNPSKILLRWHIDSWLGWVLRSREIFHYCKSVTDIQTQKLMKGKTSCFPNKVKLILRADFSWNWIRYFFFF